MNQLNELFSRDGHLTDFALAALIDGSLDDLQRLEVGEHLSFCDCCLDRYSELLTIDTLEAPEQDQTAAVMQRIRRKKWRTSIRRYTAAAVAVAIGSSLWYSGLLDAMGDTMLQPPVTERPANAISAQQEHTSRIGETIQTTVDQWSMKFQSAAASAFRSPDSRPSQSQTNQMEEPQ